MFKKRADEKVANFKRIGLNNLFAPIANNLKKVQSSFRRYVGRVEFQAAKEAVEEKRLTKAFKPTQEDDLKSLLREGDYFLEYGDSNSAENKYISAIRIDPKNVLAYKGLAEVYSRLGQLDQAEETYKFLLHLSPGDDNIYAKLGDLMEKKGDYEKAVENYEHAIVLNDLNPARFVRYGDLLKMVNQEETALEAFKQAVEIEPNNPKYLDNLVELAILVGDKKLAEKTYHELRMINFENQKLAVLKERIEKMK